MKTLTFFYFFFLLSFSLSPSLSLSIGGACQIELRRKVLICIGAIVLFVQKM